MKKLKFFIGALAIAAILGLNLNHALNGYGVESNEVLAKSGSSISTGSDAASCNCAKRFSPIVYSIHYVEVLKIFDFLVKGEFKAGTKIVVPIPRTTIKLTVEIPFDIKGEGTITVPYGGCDISFCPNICKKITVGTN